MSERDPRSLALAYLANHRVITLATTGPQGLWAAAVFYVSRGFDLFFLSAGKTRHELNLTANPRVAATIQDDDTPWQNIRGIQLEGDVFLLESRERQTAEALYVEKFPFLKRPPQALARAFRRVNWYHIRPDRLYFVDNTAGFGHRDRIKLD